MFSAGGSPPDKQHDAPKSGTSSRRPYLPLQHKPRSGSATEPPILKKLLPRNSSEPNVRHRNGTGHVTFGGRVSPASSSSKMNGLEGLHKNESFPKTCPRRRNLSSSSLPGSLMGASGMSASSSLDFAEAEDERELLDEAQCDSGMCDSPFSPFSPRDGVSASCPSGSPSQSRRSAYPLFKGVPQRQQNGKTYLVRSVSDNSPRGTPHSFSSSLSGGTLPPGSKLQDLDIVGESFESRFPWQRDVSVQCNLNLHHYRRARQDCVSSSSSQSGDLVVSSVDPPCHNTTTATTTNTNNNNNFVTTSDSQQPYPSQPGPLADPKAQNSNATSGVTRRANFTRRPRPNSMGALDNARYQSELSRFRDMVTRRGERKSDPQIMQSPPTGWRRVPLVFQEEVESVSDLESILEYPDER